MRLAWTEKGPVAQVIEMLTLIIARSSSVLFLGLFLHFCHFVVLWD